MISDSDLLPLYASRSSFFRSRVPDLLICVLSEKHVSVKACRLNNAHGKQKHTLVSLELLRGYVVHSLCGCVEYLYLVLLQAQRCNMQLLMLCLRFLTPSHSNRSTVFIFETRDGQNIRSDVNTGRFYLPLLS